MSAPLTVLCVEPSSVWRGMVRQLCDDANLEMVEATSVVEAFERVATRPPQAIAIGGQQEDFSVASFVAALKCDVSLRSIPIAVLTSIEGRSLLRGMYQPDVVIPRDPDWTERFNAFLATLQGPTGQSDAETPARVLVVEDSVSLQRIVGKFLLAAGYDVTVADNGADAVEILADAPVDLVVMDIEMPVMDGREAIAHLKATGFDRPVIALSGHDPDEFRAESKALGFVDLLGKPVARSALIETCAKHLALHLH